MRSGRGENFILKPWHYAGAFCFVYLGMRILPRSYWGKGVLLVGLMLFAWAIYLEVYWIPFERPKLTQSVQSTPPKDELSDASKEFLSRYEVYKASPTNAEAQLAYINGFPRTREGFKALFDPEDFSALYSDSEKYISPLSALDEKYPSEVERIVLPFILAGAPNCCDGWTWLGEVANTLYQDNGRRLGDTLKTLPPNQQTVLAHYLTDVENPEYRAKYCQGYISSMQKRQQKEQANLFDKVCREPFIH